MLRLQLLAARIHDLPIAPQNKLPKCKLMVGVSVVSSRKVMMMMMVVVMMMGSNLIKSLFA